jgi:hypothetical protein
VGGSGCPSLRYLPETFPDPNDAAIAANMLYGAMKAGVKLRGGRRRLGGVGRVGGMRMRGEGRRLTMDEGKRKNALLSAIADAAQMARRVNPLAQSPSPPPLVIGPHPTLVTPPQPPTSFLRQSLASPVLPALPPPSPRARPVRV